MARGFCLVDTVMGSSLRIAVDVGEWDPTLVLNSPGQSGDPRSPHYADQLGMWADGEAFPLAYTRDAVLAAAESRLLLTPERSAADDLDEPVGWM